MHGSLLRPCPSGERTLPPKPRPPRRLDSFAFGAHFHRKIRDPPLGSRQMAQCWVVELRSFAIFNCIKQQTMLTKIIIIRFAFEET